MALTFRPLRRGVHFYWPDETLTDDKGQPGDYALKFITGAAPALYGPKGAAIAGKPRGAWPTATSLQGVPGSAGVGTWATTTVYGLGALAVFNGYLYRAASAHTAADFRDDLAAGRWSPLNSALPVISPLNPALANSTSNTWNTANRAGYFRVPVGGAISQIGIEVAASLGNVAVAAYKDAGGVPGDKIAGSGIVACPAAATGVLQNISIGGTYGLAAGDWLALWASDANATFRTYNQLSSGSTSWSKVAAFENSLTGGLPATATTNPGIARAVLIIAS